MGLRRHPERVLFYSDFDFQPTAERLELAFVEGGAERCELPSVYDGVPLRLCHHLSSFRSMSNLDRGI
jgi:hypothetical protein